MKMHGLLHVYVQNVTTFGTKCIGLKIDGDLHNGGNDPNCC